MVCLEWRTVPCKKAGTRTDHDPIVRFCEPWPVFEVWTVSFCFSFSDEFWSIHWYEVMIRSRRNERPRRRTKIRRKSDNFRSWTKGFVKEKKKKKITTKQGLRPVKAAASRLLTQSPITPSLSAVASSSFFFYFSSSLSFFRWWRSLCNSSFLLNTTAINAMCSLSFLCYFVTPFEFWIPKSLTWLALEWWQVLKF